MTNIIYTRISPRPKGSIDRSCSIDIQLAACKKYCQYHGIEVDEVLSDVMVSGRDKLKERPNGSRLLDLPKGSNVIAVKLDRLWRSTADGLTCLEHFQDNGVSVHFADQGGCTINASTAVGYLIATQLLAVATFEPMMTSERTKEAKLHRMEVGICDMNAEDLPFGMKPDTSSPMTETGHHTRHVECDKEMAVVRRILNLHQYGISLRKIGNVLSNETVSHRGKDWHPMKISRIINRYKEKECNSTKAN